MTTNRSGPAEGIGKAAELRTSKPTSPSLDLRSRHVKPRPSSGRAIKRLAVTSGRSALGIIEVIDGRYVATDTTGAIVGTFPNMKAAMASFGRPR
jgi:hypothetical protein